MSGHPSTSPKRRKSTGTTTRLRKVDDNNTSAAVPPTIDPKAIAVADRVMETLGGREAWQATRYLRFDFAVEREGKTLVRRAHTWDRRTGRYRVEATDEEGRPVVVLMNLHT